MTYITKGKLAAWLEAAAVRALKTGAQAAVAMLPTSAFALGEVNWVLLASTAAGAAALSLLTSLAGVPEVEGGQSVPAIYARGEGKHARKGGE